MSVPFSRTLRSLDAERSRWPFVTAALVALAAAAVWSVAARVSVFETTDDARLETSRAAHPVASVVAGRLGDAQLRLGRRVAAGELLAELDDQDVRLAIDERRTAIRSYEARRDAIAREVAAERATLESLQAARERAGHESRAQVERVRSKLRFAQSEQQRMRTLRERNAVSAADLEAAESNYETTRASLTEAEAAVEREARDRAAQEQACLTRIARLEREIVERTGDVESEEAAVRRLERERAERRIQAPIAGRIAEVSVARAGTVVAAGEKLCSIVPDGTPRAVAWFSPAVVGRLRAGQPARLRIDGFPWTQYGTVAARVGDIDTEPRDGRVRVELTLAPSPTSIIPLEHGLTGAAEVQVERVAPCVLALRAAGQFLGTRRP